MEKKTSRVLSQNWQLFPIYKCNEKKDEGIKTNNAPTMDTKRHEKKSENADMQRDLDEGVERSF